MTGDDLRSWRETHAVSVDELAAALGTSCRQIEEWEGQRQLKTSIGRTLKYAVWDVARDRVLFNAGFPKCDWLDAGSHSLKEIGRHINSCSVCQQRIEYSEKHVEPPPIPPGLIAGIGHYGNSLSGWKKTAFSGGMLLVYMAGIAAPVILVVGLFRGDFLFAAGSLLFLVLLFVSGAAGGIAYHLTQPIRTSGRIGYYASWILVLYTYLLTVGTLIYAGETLVGAKEHEFDPSDTATWISAAVVGIVFGIVLGYSARDKKPTA